MADYYVSPASGSDSTGDGSAANPWKTAGKAAGPAPAVTLPASGPTRIVIEGGSVCREAFNLGLSPTADAPLEFIGDADGSLFAAGGVANPKAGPVEWRAWSDDSTPIANPALGLGAKSYVTLQGIRFSCGGNNFGVVTTDAGSTNITLRDCQFVLPVGGRRLMTLGGTAGQASNFLIERCEFIGDYPVSSSTRHLVYISTPRNASEYDAAIRFDSCSFVFGTVVEIAQTGSGGFIATGIAFRGCTFAGVSTALTCFNGWTTTATKAVEVRACVFLGCQNAILAGKAGQVDEDYNRFTATTARTNVDAGPHSVVNEFPGVGYGLERLSGDHLRPFLEPLAGSPLLAFAPRPAGLLTDLFGRERPDPCAAGCLERADAPPGPEPGGDTYIFQTEG